MNRIRKRVLFVAEAVTLAQVARLAALARSLPEDGYEVHFASPLFDDLIFAGTRFARWPLASVPARRAERAMRWGFRLYSRRILQRYVSDDLRLIREVRPDLIVGDLRWSLAVSGPVSGVPVATLANAYWRTGEWPMAEHPLVQIFGVERAAHHYARALPAMFRWYARPLDELREQHGLSPLGSLPEAITWGNVTLYADPPGLFEGTALKPSERFIGAVQWAPEVPWTEPSGAFIYLTMGSSGSLRAAAVALEGLADLDVEVLVATAGRRVTPLPRNASAVPFVRGDAAARAAVLVVCNGGSSTGYQALAEGTPVLGLPFNLDQYLAMRAIERAGAGVLLRSGTATPAAVREAAVKAIALREAARAAAVKLRALDPGREFLRSVEEALGQGGRL